MSRRIFVESMRQEARERRVFDSRSPTEGIGHAIDAIEAGAPNVSAVDNQRSDHTDTYNSRVHRPVPADDAVDNAAPHLSLASPSIHLLGATAESDNCKASLSWSQGSPNYSDATARISVLSDVPGHLSATSAPSPAHYPSIEEEHQRQPSELSQREGVSGSDDGARYGTRRLLDSEGKGFLQPRRSTSAIKADGNSSTKAAGALSGRRRSANGSRGRTSISTPSLDNVHENREGTVFLSKRHSLRRSSSAQKRSSISSMSSSSGHPAAAGLQSRNGSFARMEDSLVALQVELATEKRNNIEAERLIITVNKELKLLREENGRLSRELALATNTSHDIVGSHGSEAAGNTVAVASLSARPPEDAGETAAANRIRELEARLSELTHNLETKQHELDTKEERIRLLEHKLADQLLSSSGTGYMGTVPTDHSRSLRSSATEPLQQQRGASHMSHTGDDKEKKFEGNGAPSDFYWRAEAPPTARLGPKIKTIRSVSLDKADAAPRPQSVPRTGNIFSMQSDASSSYAQATTTNERSLPFASTLRLSQWDAAANRPRSATRAHCQPSPTRTVVGRDSVSAPSVPVNTDSTKSNDARRSSRADESPAHSRLFDDTQSSRRRRNSSNPAASCDQATSSSSTTGNRSLVTKQVPSPARLGSPSGPRRPSTQRRGSSSSVHSMATATRAQNYHSSSRRSSVSSPLHRQSSSTGTAGHPSRLDMSSQGAGDHRLSSPARSLHGGAHSTFLALNSPGRRSSASRSVAQQSVRSSTSTRSRPLITFSTDHEAMALKGTTTTVTFKSSSTSTTPYRSNSYARDGALLLSSRAIKSVAIEARSHKGISTATDAP